jgi:predicted transcriptional regulator
VTDVADTLYMHGNEIPADLILFLRDNFATYEHLQVLEELSRDRSIAWREGDIATKLRLEPALVRAALTSLRASGLVASRSETRGQHFVYSPVTADLDQVVTRLFETYRHQPIEIIKLMSANAIERVRTAALRAFADAFVFRKDKGNG